jgi:hypothetical protein
MAIDGTYEITIETLMGPQEGKLVMKTDGGTLSGTLENMMGVVPLQDGKVNGNEFEYTVEAKSPMGTIKVSMKGKVERDTLTGEATTPFGPAPIEGKRIG